MTAVYEAEVFFPPASLKRSRWPVEMHSRSERWRIEQLAVINIKQTFALQFTRASAGETEDDTHWEITLERMEGWRALEGGVEE